MQNKVVNADRYDVALSYASEQRIYVEAVYFHITSKGLSAYYDQVHQSELWGTNLREYLRQIFYFRSKWCIMFISNEYVAKMWPNFEREIIVSRQSAEGEYLLPVRFDDSIVPGLDPDLGYRNANKVTPKELADLFEETFFKRLKI